MERAAVGSIEDRVRELERELLALRRELQPPPEVLPAESFDVLEVCVDDQRYLIEVVAVREVLPALMPTPLPEAPDWVRGTFRFGRVAVPMVDLRLRLHGEDRAIDTTDVVVLLERDGMRGLLVSDVLDVFRVEPCHLAPPAPGISQAALLVASLSRPDAPTAHLLSTARLGREFMTDDEV